jgi:predicted amidohydrolase
MLVPSAKGAEEAKAPEGWTTEAPREEIRPRFAYEPRGGRDGKGALIIRQDDREGLDGWWSRTFPVQGGKFYRFHAVRKVAHVAEPRRSAVVRIFWLDDQGKRVVRDIPATTQFSKGSVTRAEPELPLDGATDKDGWTEVGTIYRVPATAKQAVVKLHLRWAPGGEITWSEVALTESAPPTPRPVRLAAVHYIPGGKSPMDNCREFAPLIEDAVKQKADLIVLPETLTHTRTQKTYVECAEPIPGPATDYFGELAKKHNCYIVAGLVERDRHLVYNVAILLGPDGKVAGKYRKVALPRSEIEAGIAPGKDYPIFNTRFGKLGMMVCYDGFFPEVARQLAFNGAEVIAFPVAGCNPALVGARACENHVYIVSSTYTDISRQWMITGIFDHEGKTLTRADKWGTVVVAEVDLAQRLYWPNVGDVEGEYTRHRPRVPATEKER